MHNAVVKGHPVYEHPVLVRDIHVCKLQLHNVQDPSAVAIYSDLRLVGHASAGFCSAPLFGQDTSVLVSLMCEGFYPINIAFIPCSKYPRKMECHNYINSLFALK